MAGSPTSPQRAGYFERPAYGLQSTNRVGGGHTYPRNVDTYAYKWSDLSPRRRRVSAAHAAPEQRLLRPLPALPGARAVAAVQGGSALWTAEADGRVVVRNGWSGEAVHVARTGEVEVPGPRGGTVVRRDPARVNCLAADAANVWAGLDDGAVEVYDVLVMQRIGGRRRPRRGAVDIIRCVFDGGAVAAAPAECTLSRWSGEDGGYAVVVEARLDAPPTALQGSGDCIFVGDAAGMLRLVDVATLTVRVCWDTGQGSVTCLALLDAALASGGGDGAVCVWEEGAAGEAPALRCRADRGADRGADRWRAGAAPIRFLHADGRAGQLWTADDDGVVQRWHAACGVVEPAGDPMPSPGRLVDWSVCAMHDGLRVWSTASSGTTSSWFSQWACGSEQVREAQDAMKAIVEQDAEEARKWAELARQVEEWDERRRGMASAALLLRSGMALEAVYFRKWLKWRWLMTEHQRREDLIACLTRCQAGGMLRIYWVRLKEWLQATLQRRRGRAVCDAIMCTTVKGLRRVYWRKVSDYRYRRRREERREQIVQFMLRVTDRGLTVLYYRKLMRWRMQSQQKAGIGRAAERLMRCSAASYRRWIYHRWVEWSAHRARKRRMEELARQMIPRLFHRDVRRKYMHKALRYNTLCVLRRLQAPISEKLRRLMSSHVRSTYFRCWRTWARTGPVRRRQREVAAAERKLRELQDLQRRQQSNPLMHRLQAMRERAEELGARRDELRRSVAQREQEHGELQERLQSGDQLHSGGLAGLMNKLKEESVNFHTDVELLQRIARKCAAESILTIFLEAHLEVKRVVVQFSGETSLESGAVWPVQRILNKIPPFELRKIHAAVKTMVIAFDRMTKLQLAQATTDDEIVVNSENLITLFKRSATAVGPSRLSR